MNDVQGASWVENKTGSVCINVTLRLVSVTIVAVEKKLLNVLSVYLYACLSYPGSKAHLLSAKCRIILSYVSCLAVQYFSTLSHKRHDFRERSY